MGAYSSTLYNCIVYFNTAANGANYDPSSTLNYCCTTPLPTNGVGNIALDPQLASASHLSADSPCREAGSAAYATGTDVDGEPWGSPPSIGCDEYHAGAVTGPLTVDLVANYTYVTPGYPVAFTALIEGRITDSVWVFGDGDVAINQPYISHGWTEPGDYLVALWAFNESHWGGVSATVTIHVAAHPVLYVAATSTNPQPPYLSWATAAANIQAAVTVALPGASVVLVTNGVYRGGVAVTNAVTLRSVNGPQVTIINGGGTNQCVSLTDGASLTGFTLTNGQGGVDCTSPNAFLTNCVIVGNSASYAGGAFGGTLYNCTLTGNRVTVCGGGAYGGTLYNCALTANSAEDGGGAYYSTLYNCTLTGNSASGSGGGASGCALYNCTLTGNSAGADGGGACYGTLYNCIVYYNAAGGNYLNGTLMNYCCTTPQPTNGVGNITNAPLFVNYAGGNARLQPNSPCINAGNNAYAPAGPDLDGNPRIVSGTVDIGAYEYQGTGSIISYAWLQQFGLPTDGSADLADADADGLNNWQEWRCGTCPTNCLSALRLLSASPTGTNVTVCWQSVAGVSYFLQCSTDLAALPCFAYVTTNLPGQAGTTTYTHTNAAAMPWLFYRVGVGQ